MPHHVKARAVNLHQVINRSRSRAAYSLLTEANVTHRKNWCRKIKTGMQQNKISTRRWSSSSSARSRTSPNSHRNNRLIPLIWDNHRHPRTWEWRILRASILWISKTTGSKKMTASQSQENLRESRAIWTKRKFRWLYRIRFKKCKIWQDYQPRRHQQSIWFRYRHHIGDKSRAEITWCQFQIRRHRRQKMWTAFCKQKRGGNWTASQARGTSSLWSARPRNRNPHRVRIGLWRRRRVRDHSSLELMTTSKARRVHASPPKKLATSLND